MANAFYSGMACPDRSFTAVRWPSSDPVAISPALAQALPAAEAAAATFPWSTACSNSSCQGRLGSGACLRAATSSTTTL